MPEAVIVDAIRTPIGRAVKGSLRVRPCRRPRGDPAAGPDRAQPRTGPELDRRHDDGLRLLRGRVRATTSAASRGCWRASTTTSPACTVNRFCASSLQTTRMAFHAIKAGEGDTYIAAGVEAVSRAGQGAAVRVQPAGGRLARARLRRLHPDGDDRRERRRALQRQPRGPGRVGGHLAGTRGRGRRESGHFDREIVPVTVPAHKEVDKRGQRDRRARRRS